MNYYSEPLIDMPYDNPMTKVGMAVVAAYIVYLGVRYAEKGKEDTPGSRKSRARFSTNKIDNTIDNKNRYFGGAVPANPNVPHYSRHNYNRRRRSKNFW